MYQRSISNRTAAESPRPLAARSWKQCPRGLGLLVLVAAVAVLPRPASADPAAPFVLELKVDNPTTVDRVGELVSSGVPMPRFIAGARSQTHGLTLVDDRGNLVPVQFEVLSRWGGTVDQQALPIKWLLVSFPAEVPAGETRSYFLDDQSGRVEGQLSWASGAESLTVDTGPLQVEFPTSGGDLLRGARVGEQLVVDRGFLELRDAGGVAVAVTVESTEVEVAGRVRTVVRQRLSMPALGLAATLRYQLVSGSSRLQVEVRLENNGAYGSPFAALPAATAHFESLELVLHQPAAPQSLADDRQIFTLGGGDAFEVRQDFGVASSATDVLSGFEYDVAVGGAVVSSGERFSGGLASERLTVVVDRFWQTFPKSLAVADRELRIGLFPEFGHGPEFRGRYESAPDVTGAGGSGTVLDPLDSTAFRFEGGRWSSQLLEIGFRADVEVEPDRVAQRVKALAQPLRALPADDRWVFEVFAFGELQVPRVQNLLGLSRFERMQQVLVDDSSADDLPPAGRLGLPGFRDRGGRWGGRQMFGWQNFGDLGGDYGFVSGHYDLPYVALINYFRSGDGRFFDLGRDLVRHRRDYDQYHSTDPADPLRGGQFVDTGFWHGNTAGPSPSAVWVHGLLLWHVMTGDPGAREAAVEVGEYVARQAPASWNGYWGAARFGWQLEALVHLYNYLGDEQYLLQAKAAVAQWVSLEQSQASCGEPEGCGYVLNPAYNPGAGNVPPAHQAFYQQNGTVPAYQPVGHAIVGMAMAKLWFIDRDPAVYEPLSRLAEQLLANALVPGDEAQNIGPWVHGRLCFATDTPINEPSFALHPSTHDGWAVATLLAYYDFVKVCEAGANSGQEGAGQGQGKQEVFPTTLYLAASATYQHLLHYGLVAPGTPTAAMSPIGWHVYLSATTRRQAQMSLWGTQLSSLLQLSGQVIQVGKPIQIQLEPGS